MKKTWDRAAMRFASARYIPRQGMLDVTFENGDHFLIAVEAILPGKNGTPFQRSGSRSDNHPDASAAPDWTKLQIAETGDVLEVPARDSILEIPWDRIRATADAEFRAYLTGRAIERARRIGRRLRAMRLEAGLTPAALASKAHVAREVIADLEMGKLEPATDLIENITLALGRRLRDFAEE